MSASREFCWAIRAGVVLLCWLTVSLGSVHGQSGRDFVYGQRFGLAGADARPPGMQEFLIRRALSQPTELEFIETPLSDVIDFLRDYHRIEIQIDTRAMDSMGIGTDTPITKNLKNLSLRSALRLMLRELDLTYAIRDEV